MHRQTNTCTSEGCDLKPWARDLCTKHYRQWYSQRGSDVILRPGGQKGKQMVMVDDEAGQVCGSCLVAKPYSEFYNHPTPKSGKDGYCKACRLAASQHWARTHPTEMKQRNRKFALKYGYGLTLAEYEAMVEVQHGQCAICEGGGLLVIDHDHETGAVRGLLCGNCNSALGMIGDNIAVMERAIAYLRSTNNRNRH